MGDRLLTLTEDIVKRSKEYFDNLRNSADMTSDEEAGGGNPKEGHSTTQATQTEVIKSCGNTLGREEVCSEFLAAVRCYSPLIFTVLFFSKGDNKYIHVFSHSLMALGTETLDW